MKKKQDGPLQKFYNITLQFYRPFLYSIRKQFTFSGSKENGFLQPSTYADGIIHGSYQQIWA